MCRLEGSGVALGGTAAILAAGGAVAAGRGCRGPDKICPGRGGGGSALAGIAVPGRGAACLAWVTGVDAGICAGLSRMMGGAYGSRRAPGCPASGGRIGAGFGRTGSSDNPTGVPTVVSAMLGVAPWASSRLGSSTTDFGTTESGALRAWIASASETGSGRSCPTGEVETASSECGSSVAVPLDSAVSRAGPPSSPYKTRRICSATSSSTELECVFFSVTPSFGNMSRMSCDGTSNCRASSLMRILPIDEKLSKPLCACLRLRSPSPLSYQIHPWQPRKADAASSAVPMVHSTGGPPLRR
jgi:hypothetical protein